MAGTLSLGQQAVQCQFQGDAELLIPLGAGYGSQARRLLGVSRTTICADVKALRPRYRVGRCCIYLVPADLPPGAPTTP